MGNAGSAEITIAQAAYCPGDWVQGTLILKLKKSVSGSLQLKFRSTVYTSHEYWGPNYTFTGVRLHRDYDKKRLVEMKVPFSSRDWSQALPAGEHRYPFTFQLPTGLQPTFNRVGADALTRTARLDHYLKAEFSIPGWNKSNPMTKCAIKVLAPLFGQPGVLAFPTKTVAAKTFACIGGGSVSLSVTKGSPDVIAIGHRLGFEVFVENKSKHKFKAVTVQLWESVRFHCRGEDVKQVTKLLTYSLPVEVQPGQARCVMDVGQAPVCVPQHVQPSVSVNGWLETTHWWKIKLVNDSIFGSNVVVLPAKFLKVTSGCQPEAPPPR